jgi:hypothetical protein
LYQSDTIATLDSLGFGEKLKQDNSNITEPDQ